MVKKSWRIVLLCLGWTSIAIGVIGIFLPLLPTTPFLILSAYLFSKSSEKMHNWLLSQPHVGPAIRQWDEFGVIDPRQKKLATLAIVSLFSSTLIFVKVALWIKGIVAGIGLLALAFIWTRPSHCDKLQNEQKLKQPKA